MINVHPIIQLLAAFGFGALWMLAMFALFMLVSIFKAKKLPMDTSNRINHLRLVWFAVTRPEIFTGAMPWLKHDEFDNIKNKGVRSE